MRIVISLAALLTFAAAPACTAKQEAVKQQAVEESWAVQPQSSVAFTSVKNETLPVAGKFTDVTGKVDLARYPELTGSIRVRLASLDTGNQGRDANIVTHFFEADAGATAEFVPARFETAASGPLGEVPVEGKLVGELRLHGESVRVELPVRLQKTAATLTVESLAGAELSIASFAMETQKENLRQVCAHDSIADGVKVSLKAAFQRVP